MPRNERATRAAVAPIPPPRSEGPRWRTLLETRWQERLQEVTEVSLAYHTAAEPAPARGGQEDQQEQRLLRRTVTARRDLADTEEALGRLAAGHYGRCEQRGSRVPAGLLTVLPEIRYCPRCHAVPAAARQHATVKLRAG